MENDTARLLRECESGVKMGIRSLEDILPRVKNPALEKRLCPCKEEHETLSDEMKDLLKKYDVDAKEPPLMADAMSTLKT